MDLGSLLMRNFSNIKINKNKVMVIKDKNKKQQLLNDRVIRLDNMNPVAREKEICISVTWFLFFFFNTSQFASL